MLYFISVAISMCCNPNEKPFIGCLNAAMGRNLLEGEKKKKKIVPCFLFISNRFTGRLMPSDFAFLIFSRMSSSNGPSTDKLKAS